MSINATFPGRCDVSEAGKWSEKLWRDVATLEYGKGLRGEMRQGPVPVFGTNGQIGWHDKPLCPHPGVVIGRKGAYRGVHYSPKPFHVIDTAFYLRPKVDLDARWAYFNLLAQDINGMDSGSAIPSTSREEFYSLPVSVPPLEEQRAIAHVLGTLDDKIELNQRINETLEAMARALFKSWFVDFEPVRAKMEGRDTGLPDHVADLFPSTLDNEHNPCGWSPVSLTALADVNPESWSSRNVPEEVEYVDLANTKWGTIESTQRFRWQDAPSRAKRILRPGDTIIGTVRPGNGSFALIGSSGLTGSTGFAVLRPHQHRRRAFVFLAATAPENIERLTHLADGGAYPAVRPQMVGATRAVVADQALMDVFSDLASPVLDQIHTNKEQNRALAQIRDILLPKLISGEISIADAERAVGAVA
ncbi:MAG: restriction endonuclease subunit S [Gammaproteobacteria bacterium]|nr:restriction endonuclease subunit S [Gammaproteobacteria bacterium]MDE0271610.1 restriction endonuclease subunit S [Gammaproteobacteria bacterium]